MNRGQKRRPYRMRFVATPSQTGARPQPARAGQLVLDRKRRRHLVGHGAHRPRRQQPGGKRTYTSRPLTQSHNRVSAPLT
jgi:hypothetical protein